MLVRKWVFHSLTLLSYLGTLYGMYLVPSFSVAVIAVSLLYVSFHFSMIELKHKAQLIHLGLIFLSAATLFAFIYGLTNFYFIVSVYFFHTALFFLARYELDALKNRKRLFSWEIMHIGGYVFTVFVTLAFSTLILAIYPQFPYSCEQIYDNSDKIVETIAYPFSWTADTIQTMKTNVSGWKSLSVGDALNFLGPQDYIQQGSVGPRLPMPLATHEPAQAVGLVGFIETYRKRLVDQVLEDRASVNMGICEVIVEKITTGYNNPVFQFSLILLMFVLFYPFLRILVYLVETVARIILMLLNFCKIYRFEYVVEEVEDIV